MAETLYQGNKDVFLAKVRADFDAVEDQALKAIGTIQKYSLISTDPSAGSLFTEVSNVTEEGDRAVWRNISVAGIDNLETRPAGGIYPDVEFIRGWETSVFDPDQQIAGRFKVPEERLGKEALRYRRALDRAQKLLYELDRRNIADLWEVFNFGFTLPVNYPNPRFFAKGNEGLDGNHVALNEPLISKQHALASGLATISNAVLSPTFQSEVFNADNYWSAREQGATFVDDQNKPMPMFGARVIVIVPPANNLVRTAKEIDESEWKVDVSDNNINVLEGMFTAIKSSPYLLRSYYAPSSIANNKQWFLVDEETRDPQTGDGLVKIVFVPYSSRVEEDKEVDSIVYKVKEEYSYGWTDWRNVLGSKGDGLVYSL